MIKKKLKPWYPTKEKEIQAELTQKLVYASQRIYNNSVYGNWVIVGSDVAGRLNDFITTTSYTGGTFTTTYVPVSSGSTYVNINI